MTRKDAFEKLSSRNVAVLGHIYGRGHKGRAWTRINALEYPEYRPEVLEIKFSQALSNLKYARHKRQPRPRTTTLLQMPS
jgi:hypothetical protein